jgi:L-ascorbate peroxidase
MNLNHIAKKPFFDLFYRSPCMALLLRASFHDAGMFCKTPVVQGSRGTLRFASEIQKVEGTGIDFALEQIEEIKHDGNHITALLSYSDLIQLGGYAAVEYTGGPSMVFRMGRKDAEEHEVVSDPSSIGSEQNVLDRFLKNGFSKQEFVALMGSHTLGFASMERTGPQSRWTMNPHVFDNTYYKEVLLGERSKYLKTGGEIMLARDPELRALCEKYAQDEQLFFRDYANAHVKLSELGQEANLLSEFDEPSVEQTGGYIEPV